MKSSLPTFILLDTKKTLDPAIATSGNKSDRGFYHPITAALLCPISLPATDEYVIFSNPAQRVANVICRTFKNVQDGHIVLNAKQLPRFLYPNDRTDTSGISDRVFEGYLMIRVSYCYSLTLFLTIKAGRKVHSYWAQLCYLKARGFHWTTRQCCTG